MNRFMKKIIVCVCLVAIVGAAFGVSDEDAAKMTSAMPEKGAVSPKAPRKMLVFSLCKGFKHGSIPYWEKALSIMAEKTGAFAVVHSKDMSVFTAENLKQYDAICLNNTTKLVPDAAQQKAIMDFIKGGKGIVGIHAATDNFDKWDEGKKMMGGVFTGHPWGHRGTWAVKIDDPKHPLTKMFAGKGFKINDEIYRTDPPFYSRSNQRVLISLDMSDEKTKNARGVKPGDMDTGITWIKSVGKGRLFYCSLGHNNHLTWNTPVLEHYLAGIQFAMGDLEADTTPVAAESYSIEDVLAGVAKYKEGQSRVPIIKLEALVANAAKDETKRADVEAKLIELIGGNSTFAGKQLACTQLGLIGSKKSVDILRKLIVDEKTTDMARYAAERIAGVEIDNMLIDAAKKTGGDVRIGIVNTLGVRKSAAAISMAAEMIKASDEKLSLAAIEALKRIGNAEAIEVLAKKRDVFKGALHESVMDAYLYCVDGLLAAGETKKAAKAYKYAYRLVESDPIRIAAVRGMINSAGKKKVKVILDVLQSDDPTVQVVVLAAVRELKPAKIKPILKKFKSLSETGKVQLVSAISEMKSEAVLATVSKAASSDNQALRLAGIKALATAGDADSAKQLAGIAAKSKGNEQRTCRTSLYNLAAAGTDEAIVAAYDGADAGVKIELLKAVTERKIAASKPVILKGTQDSDAKVRVEALRTVAVMQNLELSELLDALVIADSDGERRLAEKTIVLIVKAKKDTSKDAQQIVGLMGDLKKKGVDVNAAALRVLGGIGNDVGYDTLVKAISSEDEKIQRAAIDGLSVWPDGKPAEVLMATVSKGLSKSNQVMAFRGLIDQIGKAKRNKYANLYAEAMKIAPGDGEKRLVLSALSMKPCNQTLELALANVEDAKLKKEAVNAVSQILAKFTDPLSEKNLSALRKAKAGNEAISKRFIELTVNDLSAWRKPLGKWAVVGEVAKSTENEKKLVAEEGAGVIYNGPDGRTNNLLSAIEHGDVTAHIEFMVPKGSNSGVYFMGRYEIQVLDSFGVPENKLRGSHCGGIYQRWKDGKGFEGRRPRVNASKPAGEWQSFDVVFKAPKFNRRGRKQANAKFVSVVHNGKEVHKNQEVTGMTRSGMSEKEVPAGPLMLQGDHGPVAYRNIYLIKN